MEVGTAEAGGSDQAFGVSSNPKARTSSKRARRRAIVISDESESDSGSGPKEATSASTSKLADSPEDPVLLRQKSCQYQNLWFNLQRLTTELRFSRDLNSCKHKEATDFSFEGS